jgi:hypothetical protein
VGASREDHPLPTVYLLRIETGAQGTFGRLLGPEVNVHTLEPPWHDNAPTVSCIPAGSYRARVRQSPRFGRVYHIQDVAGRSWILTHWGNLGGDKARGWATHTEGCILIGAYRGTLTVGGRQQKALLYSKPTFDDVMDVLGGDEFQIKIMEAWNDGR